MELKTTIFAILAIFCLIASACAVCAADDADGIYTDDMYNGYPTEIKDIPDIDDAVQDDATGHAAGENTTDEIDSEAVHDSMVLPPDYAHSEMNQTNATNATNATGHAAGENVTNTNTTTAHTLPATGNPILALFAVGAVLGGASVLRRRK